MVVQPAQIQGQAEPPGDRGQMDDRVGRAAERHQQPQRVLERLLGHDAARPQMIGADELDRYAAGLFRHAQPIGVDGGNRRRARRRHAERLGKACHGARRAHHCAGAGGRGEALLDDVDLVAVDLAGAIFRPEAAAVGAGAEPLAAVASGRHRAGDELDRGQVGGGRAHELGRHGLVAAADAAPPRPSAARGSSPRRPSTSGCGISCWSD